ncbi:MAG TPA: septum site-determining protein MinC [Candidatus Aphodoplasma excrementigallinarum]|uniref:Probable septum site-determining protein MinC n=1 Tax=Candidatus Aphodoplasma excrementigallinarum TaxID=2840673 RepID=A0A9D1SZS2_9FIRM|nr:septum site-determining protein MinC [Candidatus Aphodoplasma excrementigallinarum]
MATNEAVRLKGIKDGIMVIVSEADFSTVLRETLQKIGEVIDFFSSGSGRILFTGHNIGGVNRIMLEQELKKLVPEHVKIEYEGEDNAFFSRFMPTDDKSRFHHGTLRSGQCLKSLGNLVVVGDVNPGAELIAAGNIVVMGILRGIVHAGCNGDRDAIVAAACMAPTQIRIADIITRPPDEEVGTEWRPEIAYVHEGNIYIDGYLSKKIK